MVVSPGHSTRDCGDGVGPRRGRNQQRADAEPERRAAGQHHEPVGEQQGGVEAGLGDVVAAAEQPVVQLLHVEQLHVQLEPAQVDAALQDRVKGERVVGAGGDADAQLHDASMLSSRSRSASSAAIQRPAGHVAVAGHVRYRPHASCRGSPPSLPPGQPRIPPSPRAPPAARPRGALGPGRATPMRAPPTAPARPARRAPPRRCRRIPAGRASGRRRRCRGSAPAAGASTAPIGASSAS